MKSWLGIAWEAPQFKFRSVNVDIHPGSRAAGKAFSLVDFRSLTRCRHASPVKVMGVLRSGGKRRGHLLRVPAVTGNSAALSSSFCEACGRRAMQGAGAGPGRVRSGADGAGQVFVPAGGGLWDARQFRKRLECRRHPVAHLETFAGILQADIYAGYNALYVAGRLPGPVIKAACWAHSRRKFFDLADIAAGKRRGKDPPPVSPLALEAVKRIDVLFDIERGIVGKSAEERLAVRRELSAPVLAELKEWMRAERVKLSKHAPVAKAMDYMLRRWELFARFLDDGRICLTNNAAERALRGIALGRKSWLFAGSDRGGVRAAAMYTLIGTAKLNDVDPQAWLADVLDRIADTPQTRLEELLPWNWVREQKLDQAA